LTFQALEAVIWEAAALALAVNSWPVKLAKLVELLIFLGV
jgi:hypothetical protein